MRDSIIADLIQQEQVRQTNGVELIASENYASDQVMEAQGSVLTNKYAEGLPGKRYYGGCAVVDEVEDIARQRLCTLFGAEWPTCSRTVAPMQTVRSCWHASNPGTRLWALTLPMGDT